MRSAFRKGTLIAATAALSLYPLSRSAKADELPNENPVKVNGMAFNTSVTGSGYLESTLDETFLDFGNQRQVTIVAGEYNQGFATNSGDLGVKYEDGESLFRVTVRYDRDLVGNLKTSEGFDTETSINGKLSLLGDVSYVSTNSPVSTDFGIGPEIKINNTDCLFPIL